VSRQAFWTRRRRVGAGPCWGPAEAPLRIRFQRAVARETPRRADRGGGLRANVTDLASVQPERAPGPPRIVPGLPWVRGQRLYRM